MIYLFFKIYFIFAICVDVFVSVLVYTMCVGTHGGPKKVLEFQGLELEVIVNHSLWVLRAKPESSKEQQLLLTAESSPQRPNDAIFTVTFCILCVLYGTGSVGHTSMGI